ncbi:MAG TPA: flagellar hook-length control protein FliK, partial [Lysobacter sp.]|nr:flagellar hook-length control protein FliK [Lysobacter sp.]
ALAALADGKGERTTAAHAGAADAPAPSAPALAFNALAARGADALQTVTRAVAVTGPTSIPLALDAAFDDGMGSRILWMADQRVDRAEIRLNPDSLGPIDVRLQMDGHRLNAQFHSANADVRQALESGMDRLRDMLGRQGMELGQAQVGAGSRQSGDGRHPASTSQGTDEVATGEPAVTTVRMLRSRGLLDEYA